MARFLVVALVTCLSLIAAPTAYANITLTYANATIGITGTGDNATFLGFDEDDATVTIRSSGTVTNNSGGACPGVFVPGLQETYYHCPGAATALNASYGAGSDQLTLEGVCIPTVTAALGNGNNRFQRPEGCSADQLATVTGGNGVDAFVGGAGPDRFDGGDGADGLRGGSGDDVLHGGPGNDSEVFGEDGNDQLFGDDGDDKLRGGAGNDAEDGGAGSDLFGDADADPGGDDVRGGPGADKLDLDAHADGVTVTLDDAANDGNPGRGDNVHSDVESVYATRGNDTLVGTANADVLNGGFADDTISGGGGDDTIDANSGNDALAGDAGNDTLYGGDGNDRVDGGTGTDNLFGDYGSCSAFGCSGGSDQLFARDGLADALNCGAGADTAQIDAIDTLAQDGFQLCETVDRPVAPPVPPKPTSDPVPAKKLAALQGATATGGKKRLTVSVTLRRASTVTITVTRVGARKALGKVTVKVKKAGKVTRVLKTVGKSKLRAGRYRVSVKVGTTTKAITVRVR